jgi:hypothetical protein
VPKTLVIIQGLLNHKGGGPNPTPAGFDGEDYLIKNADNALKCGYTVRYLCWEKERANISENLLNYFNKNSRLEIKYVQDIYTQDAKHKQFGSLYQCVTEDRSLEQESLIVKIRTDMLMPISFWQWLSRQEEFNVTQESKMFVSELNHLTGYFGDFVFISRKGKFEKEFKKYINKSHMQLHPGNSDIGLKIMSDDLKSINILTRKKTRMKWISYVEKNLGSIPKEVFAEILWRGKRIDQVLDTDKFTYTNDTASKRYKIEDFKSLLYLYQIYRKRGFENNNIMNFLVLLQNLMNVFKAINRKAKNYNLLNRERIFSRVACFGRLVIEDRNIIRNSRVYNFQKARMDYINLVLNGAIPSYEDDEDLNKLISNSELQEFQKQNLSISGFDFKNISYFIIDTFSDLTDRKFIIGGSSKYFFSHYGDLDRKSDVYKDVEDHGLVDLVQLKVEYKNFVEKVTKLNPNSQIIFINYPTKFEQRVEYIQRGKAIAQALDEISQSNKNIHNIYLSEGQVKSVDPFPYHFDEQTNKMLKYEVNRVLN